MALQYNNDQIRDIAHLINNSLNSFLHNIPAETEFTGLIYNLIEDSNRYNPWFISEHVVYALKTVAYDLETIANEKITERKNDKDSIVVLLRTNAPFEGIAEIIYLALLFDKVIVQALPELQWFFRKCLELFQQIPVLKDKIVESTGWIDKIDRIVALAPLTDTAVEYFKKYPTLQLYSNGFGIVLSGEEEKPDLEVLAERCCMYFGRGGMNVKIIIVPLEYDVSELYPFFDKYRSYLFHHKYFNNFDYRKSSLILNKIPFTECGPILLTEDLNQTGYTGVLSIKRYTEIIETGKNSKKTVIADSEFPLISLDELKNHSIFSYNFGALKSFTGSEDRQL